MTKRPIAMAAGFAMALAVPVAVVAGGSSANIADSTSTLETAASPIVTAPASLRIGPTKPRIPAGASTRQDPQEVVATVPMPAAKSRRVVAMVNTADGPRIVTRDAPDAASAERVVDRLQHKPGTATVSIDTRTHLLATDYTSSQWALPTLKSTSTWTMSSGSGVKVAIIDTGVQASHPDLSGRVLSGAQYLNNSSTSSGNGQTDGNGHGTHVSGIVAANKNNSLVTGIAPAATILPVRVLDSAGSGWNSDVNRGIIWAADHGADVINMSLGGTSSSATDAAAVQYAADAGVAVFAAAGNGGATAAANYPAAYPGAVGVSATGSTNLIASFSNRGSYVDLAAPGASIISDYPSSTVKTMSGTSMATPYAAGAAADVLARVRLTQPSTHGADVVAALLNSARDLGSVGRDNLYGYGLVDPYAAMLALEPSPSASPSVTTTPTSASATPTSATPTGSATPSPSTPTSGSPSASPTKSTTPTPTPTPSKTAVAPGAPVLVSGTLGKATVTLKYNAPTSVGSAKITGYDASCTSPGQPTRTGKGSSTARQIVVSALSGGYQYDCVVRASNGIWGAPSAAAVFVAENVPGAPTVTSSNVSQLRLISQPTARAVAKTQTATVGFTPPSPVAPAITSFQIQCLAARQSTITRTITASPAVVTGLKAGITYACSVRATNARGTGPWSS